MPYRAFLAAPSFALASALALAACSGGGDDTTDTDGATNNASSVNKDTNLSGAVEPPAEASPTPAQAKFATVPERFRGLYAPDRQACAEDYTYAPAFQNVTIAADRVGFFETGGPVTDVEVDGNAVAITLRETIGDGEFTRAIYLALNGDGTARYRPGKGDEVKAYVRCEG